MSRPPRLPDAEILALIDELKGQNAVLTGTRLREELTRRHGSPCGVARIYRLLHLRPASGSVPTVPTAAPGHPAIAQGSAKASDLQEQLRHALERAALAEYREEHHQLRWASEIHALREEVHTLREATHRLPALQREIQDRSRELAAAYRRIADLEDELLRLRVPEGR
jgi:DNA repair exonuclease SbcCD ATPase subunit